MDAKQMLDRLGETATVCDLADGGSLFRRGDNAANMYGVLSGGARLCRDTAEGGRIVIHRAGPGALFAEASLFSEVYHCDGEVAKDARIAVFPKRAVLDLMAVDGDFALAFSGHLAGQVQRLRANVELRTIRNAERRVLAALSLKLDDGARTVTLPVSWKAFAHEIGLTHEALYRTLKRLENSGQIRRDGMRVRLKKDAG